MGMNALEMQLEYPLGDTLPELGQVLDVAPGIRWLRMKLPFQLDHINLWLMRDSIDGRDGWTVVDCGIDNEPTRGAWERIFEHELQGLPVLRVIATHMHPDHLGLAHWLTERWNVRLWISANDHATALMAISGLVTIGGDRSARFMGSHGLTDPDAQEQIRARTNYYRLMVPALPEEYRRLVDGDVLVIGGHEWRCHVGYGHAPEHMSLHSPALGVLISGDMVLPRISTNVSVHEDEPEGDPLRRYLESIERMKALPADTRVLPSHGRPFMGLHTRIGQLFAHHETHFGEVLAACAEAPQSAADLLPVLFHRNLDLHQTTFAMGESIAHLHALWLRGALTRQLGSDGVYRFSTV